MSVNGDGDRVERSTISGIPYEPVYTPKTTPIDYEADLGDPGSYPFTREARYGTTLVMRGTSAAGLDTMLEEVIAMIVAAGAEPQDITRE